MSLFAKIVVSAHYFLTIYLPIRAAISKNTIAEKYLQLIVHLDQPS